MSEFPEWLEREMDLWWNPSYAESLHIHRALNEGRLKDPRERGAKPIWWRHYWPFDRRRA